MRLYTLVDAWRRRPKLRTLWGSHRAWRSQSYAGRWLSEQWVSPRRFEHDVASSQAESTGRRGA